MTDVAKLDAILAAQADGGQTERSEYLLQMSYARALGREELEVCTPAEVRYIAATLDAALDAVADVPRSR